MKAVFARPSFAPMMGTAAVVVIMAEIVLRAFVGGDMLAGYQGIPPDYAIQLFFCSALLPRCCHFPIPRFKLSNVAFSFPANCWR
jgi:hypothetical protein